MSAFWGPIEEFVFIVLSTLEDGLVLTLNCV
jgi:hypothetical protein